MDKSSEAVRIRNLHKSFEDGLIRVEVLKGIDLDCHRGQITMIVGPSGCGKTTLLSCIAGTLQFESGEISCFGKRIDLMTSAEILAFRAQYLGFIFQQFNLIPTLTLTENVSIPLLLQGTDEEEAHERSIKILDEVGLGEKTHQRPSQLSGGQQQRVAIARALVHEPQLVICDEPTSSLDGKTGLSIVELLQHLAKNKNRSVILVTHDNRIYHFADRMVEMEDGRILKIS